MDGTLFWWAAGVILLLVDIWAIASVWQTTKSTGTKAGWAVVIVVLPVVGLAIWGIAGPRGIARAPTSKEHSKG